MDRREFLGRTAQGAAAAVGLSLTSSMAKAAANDRVSVAVAGVRGRGGGLLRTFASLPQVDVTYVCDVDQRVLNERCDEVAKQTGREPKRIKDFRQALDDASVDALVLGTPDHWHALPTIHACQAGKDVYVEKPDGHNLLEGRTMVAAAKKHGRIVQLGTQARSGDNFLSAMEYIEAGHLGKVQFAKAWESGRQGSIGHPADSTPPAGVDYDFWLGPAPKRPFNPMRFHSNWRWFFDYGTGDLGNDGVHRLDVARWALDTARRAAGQDPLPTYPRRVSAYGGKFSFDDDQEWPDTLLVSYDYPGAVLAYEMRIWSPYPLFGDTEGSAVFGEEGYIVIANRRWRAYGHKDELVAQGQAEHNDVGHAQNFIDCMTSRDRPTADLETVGHPSSVLCHLGNAAWRAGRELRFDPETYSFLGDDDANQFVTRPEYRAPWYLPEIAQV